jgi:hypothetical protein
VTWEHLGTHGAVWRVNPEHADAIFASTPEGAGKSTSSERLSRAMIKKVRSALQRSHSFHFAIRGVL